MSHFLTDLIASAHGIDPLAWIAWALFMAVVIGSGVVIHRRDRAKYEAEEARRKVLARLFLDQERRIYQAVQGPRRIVSTHPDELFSGDEVA